MLGKRSISKVTWKTDVYLGEKPTEFQMFMEILEDGVLGVDGRRPAQR